MAKETGWINRHPKLMIMIIYGFIGFNFMFISEKVFEFLDNREGISELHWVYQRHIRLRESSPSSDFKVTPNLNRLKRTSSFQHKAYRCRVDEDGFIEPSKIHENPDITMFFLGGSTTESLFVDEEKRFPYLTGKIIEDSTGKKVNSYNAGRSANHAMHCLNILVNKIIPYQPKVVVLMENINDLFILSSEGSYWNNHPYRSLLIDADNLSLNPKKIMKKLFPHLSYKLLALRQQLKDHYKSKPKANDAMNLPPAGVSINKEKMKDNFRKSLESFIKVSRAWGIEVVLMTQANRFTLTPQLPYNGTLSYREYKDTYDSFNDVIRDVAKKNNCLLIDLDKLVPKTSDYMYDEVHFTNFGSEFVAKTIAGSLLNTFFNQNTIKA